MTYDEALKIAGNVHLAYYVQAAHKLGLSYEIVIRSLMARFSSGNKQWFILNTVTPLNNVPSSTISKNKNYSYRVLKSAGVPVIIQEELTDVKQAIDFFHEHSQIVIKPVRNLGGIGITIMPTTEQEVEEAFKLAESKNLSGTKVNVLGEKFFTGINYRLLVLDDKVIGAVRRNPAQVTGNGIDSIEQLIASENVIRSKKLLKPIAIDTPLRVKLQQDGHSLESVPENGVEIKLRFNANLSTGGSTEECFTEIHPHYFELAVAATKALGLKLGGVDLIAKDISKPDDAIINEVNYNPGLRLHYKVDKGEAVDVAYPIMQYIQLNL